jgi:hypothetical protein
MKIILIKFSHSYLFMSKFKTLIQSWKYEKNIQKNKFGYGIEAFPKKIYSCFILSSKLHGLQWIFPSSKNGKLKIIL